MIATSGVNIVISERILIIAVLFVGDDSKDVTSEPYRLLSNRYHLCFLSKIGKMKGTFADIHKFQSKPVKSYRDFRRKATSLLPASIADPPPKAIMTSG
jgi:hypothetical protein